jgi:membrane-anchored protein YejM (alkaline phosphatase superfamily)
MGVGNPGSDLGQAQSVAGLYFLLVSFLFCFNFFIFFDIIRVLQYLSFCLFLTESCRLNVLKEVKIVKIRKAIKKCPKFVSSNV